MFGPMQVAHVLTLSKQETVDQSVANLLELAERLKIHRWFQFPTALIIFVAQDNAPGSGEIYVYDRKRCVWLRVDFKAENYGGYSPSEFDALVTQYHFLSLAESPELLDYPVQWIVTAGHMPTALCGLPA